MAQIRRNTDDPGGQLGITNEAGAYYLAACEAVLSLFDGRAPVENDLFHISEAKGMFGRIFILGQGDRVAVSVALGNPPKLVAQKCHQWLKRLRTTMKKGGNIQPLLGEMDGLSTRKALLLAKDHLTSLGFCASTNPFRH